MLKNIAIWIQKALYLLKSVIFVCLWLAMKESMYHKPNFEEDLMIQGV